MNKLEAGENVSTCTKWYLLYKFNMHVLVIQIYVDMIDDRQNGFAQESRPINEYSIRLK